MEIESLDFIGLEIPRVYFLEVVDFFIRWKIFRSGFFRF